MSVGFDDIRAYGSANMPEDDTSLAGGAIDTSVGVVMIDIAPTGNLQIVSSAAGDTAQTVTVTGRDGAGVLITEAKTLNGTTPVAMTSETAWERVLKAVKSATTTGDVAVESATADATGTAQGGTAKTVSEPAYLTAAAGAITTDDQHRGRVLRITSGTGSGQVRRIVKTRASDDRVWVNRDWTVVPDGTSVYRFSDGVVFEKTPHELLTVVRPFFDVAADAPGGSARDFYAKIFVKNTHGTLAHTSAVVFEDTDNTGGRMAFGVAATLDDSATTTNRVTAPGGITLDSAQKNVANSGNLSPGAAQGVWLHYALEAGAPAIDADYILAEQGNST